MRPAPSTTLTWLCAAPASIRDIGLASDPGGVRDWRHGGDGKGRERTHRHHRKFLQLGVPFDPPLILVSLSRKLRSFDAFLRAARFGVSILASDQADIVQRFATPMRDKWLGIGERSPVHDLAAPPRIKRRAAFFDCERFGQHEGGDHVIFVGRVLRFERSAREPLVYHRGKFRMLAEGALRAA